MKIGAWLITQYYQIKFLVFFLCEEKVDVINVCRIYQNNLNQYVRINIDFDECLYDCNINDYILNIIDSKNNSLIRCFFNNFNFVSYIENPYEIM